MNAGLSNLTELKAYLLAKALRGSTDYDDAITSIGLGVAGTFERICNRDFAWQTGTQEITQGDRDHWYVRRSPVAAFTKVELRYFQADPWTDISGQPLAANEQTGLIHFGYTLGVRPIQVRITYDGGFWWPQLDPTDPGYPDTVPAEITNNTPGLNPKLFLLPSSLYQAWRTQCEISWKMHDKLGKNIAGEESKSRGPLYQINDEDLAPSVLRVLQQFKRYQLT